MFKFKGSQVLRTALYWKTPAYVDSCVIPDCPEQFRDKAEEWAHSWYHIKDNQNQLKQLASR